MSLFSELRKRRLFQIVATFVAAGWLVLEVLAALIEREILDNILYRVALVWYIGGIVGSVVVGWYHGEKGEQRAPAREIVALGFIALVTLLFSGSIASNHLRMTQIADAREFGYPLSSVAVLYFDDRSAPESGQYLGDVLTEGLIDRLQEVDRLNVVSANGVLPLRGAEVSAAEVGEMFGAGTVVDGVVERDGGDVRVALRLLDGNSGFEMARTEMRLAASDVLEAPNAVAEEVGRVFRERLGEEVRVREMAPTEENLDAWRAFQTADKLAKDADALALHGDPAAGDTYDRADSLAELASRLDPEWADPPTLRARMAFDRAQDATEGAHRAEWVRVGMEEAQTALSVEPDHPPALEVRGGLQLFAHLAHLAHDAQEHADLLSRARRDLERAVRLDRSLAGAHAMLSVLYYQPGIADLSAAALAARQAYESDAYLRTADAVLDRLFWTNLDLGQFAQARRWCEEGAERFPEDSRFLSCRLWLMTSPGTTPDIEEGWSIQRRLAEGIGGQGRVVIDGIRARMLMAGAIGRVAEGLEDANRRTELADSARRVLERAHEDYVQIDDPARELLSVEAFSWVILDDFERAIERWKVYAAVNHGFQQAGDISWRWRELREHPNFQDVITRGPSD